MSIDITPAIPGHQLIQRYGEGGFRVNGKDYPGSIIVHDEATLAWDVTSVDQITLTNLASVMAVSSPGDILLVGCGARFTPPSLELRAGLKEHGIALEWMDTGAACRTFNVLMAEGRRVAAALIAIP